jgi:hypothetical protein
LYLQAHDPIVRALFIDAVDAQVANSDVVECGRFLGLAAGELRASLRSFHERTAANFQDSVPRRVASSGRKIEVDPSGFLWTKVRKRWWSWRAAQVMAIARMKNRPKPPPLSSMKRTVGAPPPLDHLSGRSPWQPHKSMHLLRRQCTTQCRAGCFWGDNSDAKSRGLL